ncbi:MAG TPA: hypothetical protein PLP17_00635, partial [Oligoflexia bacterium]|nr:hypothetical protein [Oligoflexia bacterium]
MCAVLADRILLRRVMRRLPICLGVIVGLKSIASGFQAIFPPLSYRKDFFQDYLLARALISGENPYAPL